MSNSIYVDSLVGSLSVFASAIALFLYGGGRIECAFMLDRTAGGVTGVR